MLICIGIGMGVSVEEMQTVLRFSKFALLDPKDEREAIIIFGIFRGLTVGNINDLLFESGADTFFEN